MDASAKRALIFFAWLTLFAGVVWLFFYLVDDAEGEHLRRFLHWALPIGALAAGVLVFKLLRRLPW